MKKNKKMPVSPVVLVLLGWVLVLAVYSVMYLLPAKSELTVLRNDTALKRTEVQLFEQYLTDVKPLEKEVAELETEIKKINDSFINDANVNFAISDAIQRYQVSLSSVTLDSVTTYKGLRALPINLTLQGATESILAFIEHFENSEKGSFVVRTANMTITAYNSSATIVLYLCTPSV